jgi:hypothetical protein
MVTNIYYDNQELKFKYQPISTALKPVIFYLLLKVLLKIK